MEIEKIRQDGGIGEGLLRRNSNLKVRTGQQGVFVEKSYHARYTVQEEYEAYQNLAELFASTPGVRLATVYGIDTGKNKIRLEYISGPNLLEAYLQRGVSTFSQQLDVLISLFSKAKVKKLNFDSDPSNFMIDNGTQTLVLVDPVSAKIDLEDFCMVVFLWGFIKCFIRSRAPHRFFTFWKCWKMYYVSYLHESNIESKDLNGQISRYVDVVIGWNLNESQQDAWWKRIARIIIVVPAWRIIQLPFKRNWVAG